MKNASFRIAVLALIGMVALSGVARTAPFLQGAPDEPESELPQVRLRNLEEEVSSLHNDDFARLANQIATVEAQCAKLETTVAELREKLDAQEAVPSEEVLRIRWRDCVWRKFGSREQSHDPQIEQWCPEGGFITVIDLDSETRPYIGRVRCCSPHFIP